jgi:hypothetical protein
MTYTLIITVFNGRVIYFTGFDKFRQVCFSANILIFSGDSYPQFKKDEIIKNWKVLRYQMRIDSLKRKIFEINK